MRLLLVVLDRDLAGDLRDLREALRLARLEELDDAREAVRDVGARDTSGVEGPHRELRAGLADRLGGDDADRVAEVAHRAGREGDAVAELAHAGLGLALERRANRDLDVLLVAERLGDLVAALARSISWFFFSSSRPRLVANFWQPRRPIRLSLTCRRPRRAPSR